MSSVCTNKYQVICEASLLCHNQSAIVKLMLGENYIMRGYTRQGMLLILPCRSKNRQYICHLYGFYIMLQIKIRIFHIFSILSYYEIFDLAKALLIRKSLCIRKTGFILIRTLLGE